MLFPFLKKVLFIFREKGREGEREGEKYQCVVASRTPPTGDLACNPGMCPDWESNWQPFGLQAGTQSTEPHQPGPLSSSFENLKFSSKPQAMGLVLSIVLCTGLRAEVSLDPPF